MTADAFIKEYKKLIQNYPLPPLRMEGTDNCQYCDQVFFSKNLTYCFDSARSSESVYIFDSNLVSNSADCDYAVEAELCYEAVDPYKCFNCSYLEYCATMRDSDFCAWCINCNDVFGCVKLQNKSFCIFNRQLTEEDYREKIKIYKSWPAEKVLNEVENLKLKFPFSQTNGANNENSDFGNFVHYNKNCYMCFDAAHDEDCGYLYDSFYNQTCFDGTYAAVNCQLSYQVVDSIELFNCNYMVYCKGCSDSSYLFNCGNLKDCLGCVALENKQYCILNRQFSEQEYQKLSNEILKELAAKKIGWDEIEIYP